MSWHTLRETDPQRATEGTPVPGCVLVFSGDSPTLLPLRLPATGLILGRELLGSQSTDDRISRQHARIRWTGDRFAVTDLDSRNGTYAGGLRVTGEIPIEPTCVLRTGRTIALLLADIRPFEESAVDVRNEAVVGPTLAVSWQQVARAARAGTTLLLTGESGTGKELAARVFHDAAIDSKAATGQLIAVNCAAIPAGVAERLLFGTRRGAYSGADRDAEGYLAAADNGTLFLDEIGDLDLAVQTKLLRVLETGELLPLGAARPQPVRLRVVAATLKDLRSEVVAGRFREDLYYRIGRPEVRIPPLRGRLEEVPWLIWREIQKVDTHLALHVSLVEACMVRPWPGNLRELIGEIRRAAHAALDGSRTAVRAEDLDERAGTALASGLGGIEPRNDGPPTTLPMKRKPTVMPDRAAIERALKAERGNVTRAARALGIHRNQLRRWLARVPDALHLVSGKDDVDDTSGTHDGRLRDPLED
jgi:DNA-binding NtrC family response regulator